MKKRPQLYRHQNFNERKTSKLLHHFYISQLKRSPLSSSNINRKANCCKISTAQYSHMCSDTFYSQTLNHLISADPPPDPLTPILWSTTFIVTVQGTRNFGSTRPFQEMGSCSTWTLLSVLKFDASLVLFPRSSINLDTLTTILKKKSAKIQSQKFIFFTGKEHFKLLFTTTLRSQ